MTSAQVKYDDNNGLYVIIEKDEMTTYLFRVDEIDNFFRAIDKGKYKSIRIYKNSLKLVASDEELEIKDIARFCRDGWIKSIPSIEKKAKKTIVNFNRKQAKGKKRKNTKLGRKKIIGTGIVMGMLMATPIILNNLDLNEPEIEEQQDEKLDDNIDIIEQTYNAATNLNYTLDDLVEVAEENYVAQEAVQLNEEPISEQIGNQVYLDYALSTDIDKRQHAYEKYHELVERFSFKWGLSFNLVMAILTQESGGYKTNLMQIEFDAWKDKEIKVYNFEDNRYEYFILTNNPEKYANDNVTCITEKDLENPITNISIGCVILRKSGEYMDYHVLAGVQCYNLGYDNMQDVLDETVEQTGQTRDEILSDQENVTFYQYTDIVDEGDPDYLSNVFAFLSDYGEVITFKHFDENNEIVEEEISIFSTNYTK